MTEKPYTPTTSIFDSLVVPWALVGMMFAVAFGATFWIAVPS